MELQQEIKDFNTDLIELIRKHSKKIPTHEIVGLLEGAKFYLIYRSLDEVKNKGRCPGNKNEK